MMMGKSVLDGCQSCFSNVTVVPGVSQYSLQITAPGDEEENSNGCSGFDG